MKKTTASLLLAAVLLLGLAGCNASAAAPNATNGTMHGTPSSASLQSESAAPSPPTPQSIDLDELKNEEGLIMVEITMENGGVIKLALDAEAAPITVENFVKLASDGFYDGLIFHRIIDGFMIQGGDPTGTGAGGPGWQIKGEFAENGWNNPISHERGVISMARSNAPDSAGSQFFITNGDSQFLDGKYAAFGRVTEGMDVVDAIAATATDSNDRPLEDVVIKTIRVVE